MYDLIISFNKFSETVIFSSKAVIYKLAVKEMLQLKISNMYDFSGTRNDAWSPRTLSLYFLPHL